MNGASEQWCYCWYTVMLFSKLQFIALLFRISKMHFLMRVSKFLERCIMATYVCANAFVRLSVGVPISESQKHLLISILRQLIIFFINYLPLITYAHKIQRLTSFCYCSAWDWAQFYYKNFCTQSNLCGYIYGFSFCQPPRLTLLSVFKPRDQ